MVFCAGEGIGGRMLVLRTCATKYGKEGFAWFFVLGKALVGEGWFCERAPQSVVKKDLRGFLF